MNIRLPVLAVCAAASAARPAAAELLWSTNPDLPTSYSQWLVGPSAVTPAMDLEVADDFNVLGFVEQITADGEDCNSGCFGGQPVTGVFVRFYEWTAAGPGVLQDARFIAEGDPNFQYATCCGPELLEITLVPPFEATGWHFMSVQVAFDGTAPADQWNFHRTNVGGPMGQAARIRDNAGGGAWTEYHATQGWPPLDVSFRLDGTATGITPPDILDVTPDPATPSGRLRISGDGFGDAQGAGAVTVGGAPAIVTQWDDETIIAYVPEATAPGAAAVAVVIDGEVADEYELAIEPRAPAGRVLWRFPVDADYVGHRVGIGPGGDVYILDLHGRLYKLSPDGGLVWLVDALRGQTGLGAEGPVVVGDDGTVYAVVNPLGPNTDLVAYNPDGTLRWVFIDPASWGAAAGPAVGPDGNVYVAFYALGGTSLGLVSLTPQGDLRWTNPGSPTLYEHGAVGVELAFGPSQPGGEPDQVVLTVDRDLDPWLYAFAMDDGDQRWAVQRGATEDPFLQFQIQPAAGDGTVYMTEFTGLGGLGWGLKAFDAADGTELWRFDPDIASGASGPEVGADGTIYFSWDISRVSAVTPDGAEIWRHVDLDLVRTIPAVSPRNDVVLVGGGNFGVPGRFKALDAGSGDELWRIDLPRENGDVVPDARATFTGDGATAYWPVSILADPEPYQYCYVYALRIAGGAPGDLDGDGDVDVVDFLALLAAWGPCGGCAADLDGDGVVGILDLLILLGNWG